VEIINKKRNGETNGRSRRMSTSIFWIKKQLNSSNRLKVIDENIGEFEFNGNTLKVYCPVTTEYEINVDVLLKASDKGANIITYPTSWCEATVEAISLSRNYGIEIMPFGKFLGIYGEQ